MQQSPSAQPADDMLIAKARSGDSRAFDSLFTRYKDGVYACLWHLLDGDADLVEDAVGTVFLNAYRGLRQFRGGSSLSTWLYRIAVNEAHARRRQKRSWLGVTARLETAGQAAAPDSADAIVEVDERGRLWKAVRALPEPYRTPVIMRYMSGLSSQEISGVLRRPAGTVRYQLSRAMQLLRERLGSEWEIVSEPLEDKLNAARGPDMPPEVEARVRNRIQQAIAHRPPRRRASYAQIILLAVLVIVAGWVVVNNVVPIVRAAWDRYCNTR